ncbi:MAG: peptidase T, partial [Rikenellaceae bacterium]
MQKRFLKYVTFDTQSCEKSQTIPSTVGQTVLIKHLAQEMEEIGLEDITINKYGDLIATIPSTLSEELTAKVPVVGFLAHVDTATDLSGKDVKPQIFKYEGGDIVINKELDVVLKAEQLEPYIGHSIITSDGTTLLGADDKAGVAEIMNAAEYLINNPDIKHGTIRIAFTHDEEIGLGMQNFDAKEFGAKYAYTIDGGALGSLEYETFNAARAEVTFKGLSVHPGYAKDKMINAAHQAVLFDNALPQERPESTCGREGFYHMMSMEGGCESATLNYIIRDHDSEIFAQRKQIITETAEQFGGKVTIKDQYRNMGEVIETMPEVVDIAIEAMKACEVEPKIEAVRIG